MELTRHDIMMTWVSLVHAGTHFPRALSQYLQDEVGVSLPEQDLLKQLDSAGCELKLVELARRIYLSKAGVSKMVNRLETAGCVIRRPSEADRRVILAQLTPKGKKVLDQSRKLLVAWVESNLGDHLSPMQLLALRDSLETLLRGHDRWEGQLTHLSGGKPTKM